MALCELALARELGLAWWYPGFLVEDCPKMAYKARYRPCQVLRDGVWRDRA
jgi:arginine-tRNA-protein transferase